MGEEPDDAARRQTKRGDISWNQALVIAGLALTIPGLLFGPPVVGYWLDSLFHTDPWITVTGFVVGLLGTAIDVWQILRRIGLTE